MKRLRLVFGLALVPLCMLLGSFIAIGGGSAIVIGFIVGVALSYLFLTYGPGHSKNLYPGPYFLNQRNYINGGLNKQLMMEEATRSAQEVARMTREYCINPRR